LRIERQTATALNAEIAENAENSVNLGKGKRPVPSRDRKERNAENGVDQAKGERQRL